LTGRVGSDWTASGTIDGALVVGSDWTASGTIDGALVVSSS